MKSSLILLLALMFNAFCSIEAQNVNENIEKGFVEMQSAIMNKDFKKSVEYIADELFKVIPKDQLISVLELTFNNPQMEIELSLPENISISIQMKEGGKYYSILSFPSIQKIRLLDPNGLPLSKDDEKVISMRSAFESVAGADNVTFDDESMFFTVIIDQKAVAISENGKVGWKYMNFDKSQATLFEQLLPKTVIEKLQ